MHGGGGVHGLSLGEPHGEYMHNMDESTDFMWMWKSAICKCMI